MKDEIHNTNINPDVVEQFLALIGTHCKSSEETLAMLDTFCYNLMVTCSIHSIDNQMLNGHGISIRLQRIDIAERPGKSIH